MPGGGEKPGQDAAAWTNTDLVRRLKRIEGQVRGLQRMIEEGRTCSEVLIQLAALREAVNKVGVTMIARHVESCLAEPAAEGEVGPAGKFDRRGRLKEAVQMFLKFS